MQTPLLFGVSLAAGYALATRAGRSSRLQSLESLATATRELTDDVALQSAVGALSGRASELLADARRLVSIQE